jgi:co-chaperonin GroES (HSP10)
MTFHANIDVEATLKKAAELGDKLPDPVGYQLLVIKPKIEEVTAGGIIKPHEFLRKEEAGSVLGLVIKVGDLAYVDKERFPTGAWCGVNDFVLIGAYRGSRFSVDGEEFTIINDDQILATVKDASGINRAY